MSNSILFLGDSITVAYGLDISLSFPIKICKYLKSLGKNYNILNAAVPGTSTDQGLIQLRSHLRKENNITHIVCALGLVDGIYGFEPQVIKNNLQKIKREIKNFDKNIKIFQVQAKILPHEFLHNLSKSYKREYEDVFKQISKENNIILLPYFLAGVAMNPKLTQADGIHPNEEGMI
jgi:acyl-CoA thioesterase-1